MVCGWYLSSLDYKLHHTLGTMYPKCGDAVTRERVGRIVDLKCLNWLKLLKKLKKIENFCFSSMLELHENRHFQLLIGSLLILN